MEILVQQETLEVLASQATQVLRAIQVLLERMGQLETRAQQALLAALVRLEQQGLLARQETV